MRVAAIYDIHGNLPALEAVLQDIQREAVDLVVVGGDVLPGPMPTETLDRLEDIGVPARFIQGNGDREVLAVLGGVESTAIPETYRPVMQWVAQQLQPEHVRRIACWPKSETVHVTGLGAVLFCHATPRSDTELFTRLTPDHRLMPAFSGVPARTVICGHTHMQFQRRIGAVHVFNAGSVGMPFGEPGAYWLIVGPTDVQFSRTSYDFPAAAARIRETRCPQAADFAANNILSPPSEAQMLELFTRPTRVRD